MYVGSKIRSISKFLKIKGTSGLAKPRTVGTRLKTFTRLGVMPTESGRSHYQLFPVSFRSNLPPLCELNLPGPACFLQLLGMLLGSATWQAFEDSSDRQHECEGPAPV